MDTASDVLASVLDRTGLRGRVYCRTQARAPWGLRFEHQPGAMFHVILSGACQLTCGSERIQLAAGDVVLLPRATAHTVADHPKSPKLDLAAWLARASPSAHGMRLGSDAGAVTEVLCGVYEFRVATAHHPVLDLLPDRVHLRPGVARSDLAGTLASLRGESERGTLGSALVVSRLLDVMFVQIVRAWVETVGAAGSGWIGALDDVVLGRALVAVHAEPARAWTVDELARASGTSRATLARRFASQVGEPPLSYVTRVRLHEAARRLAAGGDGLAAVAADVGYASEFAFSRAFRRQFAEPPGKFRERMRSAAAAERSS